MPSGPDDERGGGGFRILGRQKKVALRMEPALVSVALSPDGAGGPGISPARIFGETRGQVHSAVERQIGRSANW